MDRDVPQSQSDSENEVSMGQKNEEDDAVVKKPLSRSSTAECDEWVLVNATGGEVEDASSHVHCHDVDVAAANFAAPTATEDAVMTMAIDLKSSVDVHCLATMPKESSLDKELEDEKQDKSEPEEEITSIISLTASVASSEVTDNGLVESFSRAEEKTIKITEPSETSSQMSLLDNVEDDLSMASSTAGTDFGYEVVSELRSRADQTEDLLEEVEQTTPVTGDDLYNERTRNYWKLSFLLVVMASAAVLGLSIGIAQVRLSRPNSNMQKLQKEQLTVLDDRLVKCLNSLRLAEAELDGGQSPKKECTEEYCHADEKPTCILAGVDFEVQLLECSKRLETCREQLMAVDDENKKRAVTLMKTFRDLRLLRQNLLHVHSTYEQLSSLIVNYYDENRETMDEQSKSKSEQEMEELTKKLSEAQSREENLVRQEIELKSMLSKLESNVEALNSELALMKIETGEYKKEYESCLNKKESIDRIDIDEEKEEIEKEEISKSDDFDWSRLTDLLQQLKTTTKIDRFLETYFDLFKDLKLPEINISKFWWSDANRFDEAASTLRKNLDEKLHELEQILYATDWDDYVRKAKDVTKTVGETMGNLWKKAKDLSEQVRQEHGERGEKIFNDIKSKFDRRWEQAARFWRDVVGTSQFETEDESVEEENGNDQKENEKGEEEGEESIDQPDHRYRWMDDNDPWEGPNGETVEEWDRSIPEIQDQAIDQSIDHSMDQAIDKSDQSIESIIETGKSNRMASEIKQLRESLKSSSIFSRYVTDEFADHYFRRLKQASRSLSHGDDDNDALWWTCQKFWWTHHSFAYGKQCSDKLTTWQRHVRVDVDVRRKLIDQTPELKSIIDKLTDQGQSQSGVKTTTTTSDTGANWVFEWAKNRKEIRKEEEKNSWLYERWRNRNEIRRRQDEDGVKGKRGGEKQATFMRFKRQDGTGDEFSFLGKRGKEGKKQKHRR